MDSYADGKPAFRDPCNCHFDIFDFRTSSESRKTSTVTRMATLPSAIPVTVDIFEFRTQSESSKNVDSYEDGDPDPRDPCDS